MNNPTLPRIVTLTARALVRLVLGHQFTHRDFQNETASYRLSSYIKRLRNGYGWPIETKAATAPMNDKTGRITTYGRYLVEPDVLIGIRLIMRERLIRFTDAVQCFERGESHA